MGQLLGLYAIGLSEAELQTSWTKRYAYRQTPAPTGVSLVFHGESVQVTGIPSVFMVREASELRRGRPTVALDIVQV